MNTGEAAAKRPYTQQARAVAAEETRRRILGAAMALYMERWFDQMTLDEVAARAGVTVQTVLRRFGSKEALFAATAAENQQEVVQQRSAAPVGDLAGAIGNLFDHYEATADLVLRSLAQEGRHAPIRAITDQGRRYHREWVERTFAPLLAGLAAPERARRRAQLVAVTDVYVWKLLRRDQGLDRPQAELAVRELIAGLTREPAGGTTAGGDDGHG